MVADHGAGGGMGRAELVAQLRDLGVEEGDVLVVHTSFRTVRPVRDGPEGLLRALISAVGEAGTLVLPSWTDDDDHVFDPRTTPTAAALGVVPDTFWRLDGVVRSPHPFGCAAIGPLAERITSGPTPIPPYIAGSPLREVLALDGKVLLVGVGHDADTMIHVAEELAAVPYGVPKHITVLEERRPVRVDYRENDHCCERFGLVEGWLAERGLQAKGPIGNGRALLARAADIVAVTRERLAEDPLVLLHPPEAECPECDLARRTVRPDGVRRLGPDDLPTVRAAVAVLKGSEGSAAAGWAALGRFIRHPSNVLLAAFVGGRPVGALLAYLLDRTEGWPMLCLYEIRVEPDHRRRGIGKSLVEALEQLRQAVGGVKTWTVTGQDNASARALFTATGAEPEPAGGSVVFRWTA